MHVVHLCQQLGNIQLCRALECVQPFSEPAAFAAGETPRTSAVAAIAPADTTERIFFKISAFPCWLSLQIFVEHRTITQIELVQ
jgi:hypothetical protein